MAKPAQEVMGAARSEGRWPDARDPASPRPELGCPRPESYHPAGRDACLQDTYSRGCIFFQD